MHIFYLVSLEDDSLKRGHLRAFHFFVVYVQNSELHALNVSNIANMKGTFQEMSEFT